MKKNYTVYKLTAKESIRLLVESGILFSLIAFLFYHSFYALIPLFLLTPFYIRYRKAELLREQRRRIHDDFRIFLDALSVSISAGASAEGAFARLPAELEASLGPSHPLTLESALIASGLARNEPAEQLLSDFAQRSGEPQILRFAAVFMIARKSGGNMADILRGAAQQIASRIEVERDIAASLASRRLEQQVMSCMPMVFLAYLHFTSPDFLEVLYGTLPGIALMTGCLLLYAFAYWLGNRIIAIEV